MRVFGVDVGTVRTGVAISDSLRTVATPHGTVAGGDGLAERLSSLARDLECHTVVVGLPKGMSGRDTASTRNARAVASQLEQQGFDVHLWDERLSSVSAERVLVEAGRRREQRKHERDQIAAAIILQGWLDAHGSSA